MSDNLGVVGSKIIWTEQRMYITLQMKNEVNTQTHIHYYIMNREFLFCLLAFLMGVQITVNAQEPTMSDVQNSGCLNETRASEDERIPTIILTKEGSILSLQLLNYEAICGTSDFSVTPSISGGSDGRPYSLSIRVEAYGDSQADCYCPYNISFTLSDWVANSFRFSCWWFNGVVNLTEGEPLVLEDIKEDVSIDGLTYRIHKVMHTAILTDGKTWTDADEIMGSGELIIPSELEYEGEKYTVTSINGNAFWRNTSLSSVTIPGSVTTIETAAFAYCTRLKSVVIFEGVKAIAPYAFYNCYDLRSITIPSSVTHIGRGAFARCRSRKKVFCYADHVPETEDDVFDSSNIDIATLHVPEGSVDSYKAASPWNGFGSIVALSGTPSIDINETNFPDEGFRNWVLSQNYGADGVLTEADIDDVSDIDVRDSNYNIYNLKGIEFFTQLRTLLCSDTKLTSLDVSKNKKLEKLSCERCGLKELNVSGCTALRRLDCYKNGLKALDLSNNTELEYLYCMENQLTVLDISNCRKLHSLECKLNQLTTLDVSACTELTTLGCFDNQLQTLDISNNIKLQQLFCENNQLKELNVSNRNTELIGLRCYYNQIRGTAMDALVENLPALSARMYVMGYEDEQNVMTKAQVAAAKAKGWVPYAYTGVLDHWEEYEGSDDAVSFTQGQVATIVLPTTLEAEKGRYYRLSRCEDNKIIFVEEPNPKAHTPYIIVPNEDFSIVLDSLNLEGMRSDTVSAQGLYFIGAYSRKELTCPDGYYIDILDATPDCRMASDSMERPIIGALRAYLVVNWDDPYSQGGSKDVREKKEIVLLLHSKQEMMYQQLRLCHQTLKTDCQQ